MFEATPTAFVITAGQENNEYFSFLARFKEISRKQFNKEHIPMKHCQENIWLIKPANQNQGRGIEVFKSLKDIYSFLSSKQSNSYWVAQKYIEKPLLYKSRKFDLRVWSIVSAKGELFMYRQGYMRTSSASYDTSNLVDNYIHLTNNCLQQKGNAYGQHEPGNTLPLSELWGFLTKKFGSTEVQLETFIMQKIKDLIIDTFLSIKK